MSQHAERIAQNLARVRDRITAAAERSGRAPSSVTLLAVTKYVPVEIAADVVAAGCHDLGESRPQELWSKAASLSDVPVRWHLVGHLQRNKIRRTLPLVHMVQSVDSVRLLEALEEAAGAEPCSLPALLEVNISGDTSKTGLSVAELEPVVEFCQTLRHVDIRGLMGMASLEGDKTSARSDFARLRELRDKLRPHIASTTNLDVLSMGMSDDFEIAIEEGATIVRLGSILFEGIDA